MRNPGLVCLALAVSTICAPEATAGDIGIWSGSERSWASPFISNLNSWLTLNGHSILPSSAAAPTPDMEVFIVSEAEMTPTPTFLAALGSWLQSGGKLILLTDQGLPLNDIDTILCSATNNVMWYAGCGVTQPIVVLSASSASIDTSVVTTQPGNVVDTASTGLLAATSAGLKVTGGNPLVGDYARWISVGSGFVFAFGDRLDHNALLPGPPAFNANAALFLALVNLTSGREQPPPDGGGGGDGGAGDVVPEPSSLFLLMAGIASVVFSSRREPRR